MSILYSIPVHECEECVKQMCDGILFFIDGCHDYNCKIHDLKMAMEKTKYVIIDDYDYHTDVRNSVSQFMRDYAKRIEWSLYIPTFRGSQLIKFRTEDSKFQLSGIPGSLSIKN